MVREKKKRIRKRERKRREGEKVEEMKEVEREEVVTIYKTLIVHSNIKLHETDHNILNTANTYPFYFQPFCITFCL